MPPALTRGPDRLDGLTILDEVKGDLGLVLWRSARNVRLWAETPAERRGELFAGGAARVRREELERVELDAELLAPMSVIVALLEEPGRAEVGRLVNACRRISLWAEQRGALATALEFAQAAALASPGTAALAYGVGRLARRRSDYDRAESWYTRAAVQARQTGDWRAFALAFSGMGNLHMQRGNYPAARRAHLRCLRVARRRGLGDLRGDSYHDLFAVAIEMRAGFEADALAERAFRAYGRDSAKVLRLAYDVAYHWTLQGFFTGALRVAAALVPHMTEPTARAALFGLIGRAAGGAGVRSAFDDAVEKLEGLLPEASETAARALLGLAHGAASLGEWSAARGWAERALETATRHSEHRVALEAEATLEAAHGRVLRTAAPARETEPAPAAMLAGQFVEVLGGLAAAAAG